MFSVIISLAIVAVAQSQNFNTGLTGLGGAMISPFTTQQTFAPQTALSQLLAQTNQGVLGTGSGMGLGGLTGQGFQAPLAGGNLFGQGQGLFTQRQGLFNQGQGLLGQAQNLLGQGQGQGLLGTNAMLLGQANNMFGASPNNFLGQPNTNMFGQGNTGMLGIGNTGRGMQGSLGLLGQSGLTNTLGGQSLLSQPRGGLFGQNMLGQGLATSPLTTGLGSVNTGQNSLNDPLVMSMLLGGESSDSFFPMLGEGGLGSCACPRNYSPVCTTTGETYSNRCMAQCSARVVVCQNACPCM